MKRIMAILGLAAVMSIVSVGSGNAAKNNVTKKCRIKKTGDNKWKFKGKRCERVVNGRVYTDTYYFY
jgi:hypothetical protein